MAQFEIDSPSALVTEPLSIRLTDIAPGCNVTIAAQFPDDADQQWASEAVFVADTTGTIDLAIAQPLSGTYSKPDAMGLFWSMALIPEDSKNVIPYINTVTQSLDPLLISLSAKIGDENVAETTVTRHFIAETVGRIDIREDGLVATLFVPTELSQARTEARPTVLVVGGSGGGFGWSHQMASLLASHGCVTMAVAYFDWQGQFGLPTGLMEIPLEGFEYAIRYLEKVSHINLGDLTVVGYSKGGELALLLGAEFSQIKRVAAYMPSGIVWEGIKFPRPEEPRSSWMVHAKPFAFAASANRWESVDDAVQGIHALYSAPLENDCSLGGDSSAAINKAVIPVEQIDGPVLLISATEDQVWPSSKMAELVVARLTVHEHPHAVQHLVLDGAGHNISVPYLPNSAMNVVADVKAWDALLGFLGLSQQDV